MLDSAMGFLARHMTASEIQAFTQSGWTNRAAWYYWNEELAGSIGYFLLLTVCGIAFGALGGLAGMLYTRISRRANTPAPPRNPPA